MPERGRSDTGSSFDGDSNLALKVLAPTLGPTGTMLVRLVTISLRSGPAEWHIADLAGLLGVPPSKIRSTFDRLAVFRWARPGEHGPELRTRGALTERQLTHLPPMLVDLYLAA